jgi:two-component system, OmpR family, response regulator BaeR
MKQHHILLVDDEPSIAEVVRHRLVGEGYVVEHAADGTTGLERFLAWQPDLVILDLTLPGLGGLELFKEMRARAPGTPVIMLTSRADEVDRVLGLELGADDYITKPFSPRELAARVRAVLRRVVGVRSALSSNHLRVGPLVLDLDAFTCRFFDTSVSLTRAEFQALSALLRHPARAYTRDRLLDEMHEHAHGVTDRSVDATIKRVRRKLAEVRPDVEVVETLYGVGYKLHPSLEAPR